MLIPLGLLMRALKKANPDMPWVVVTERVSRVSSRALEYFEVAQQQNGVDCGVYVCMFEKELVGRAFQFMEDGIAHPRYSALQCRREIRALMCEAGEGSLLESLQLKGADIPQQSDQHGGEDSDSDQGVVEIKEPTIQDVAAEQCSHAAQLKNLHEDMDALKDAVHKGEQGLDKVTMSLSSLVTAFQQLAAKIGFKLPTSGLEDLDNDNPTASTAAAPPPQRVAGTTTEAPANRGADPHASACGASHARATHGLPAVPSRTMHGQAVPPACATTAACGMPGFGDGSLRASAAPDGALRQPGASAGIAAAATGQTGAAAGQAGPATGVPSTSAGHATAAGGVPDGAGSLGGGAANLPATAAGPPGGSVRVQPHAGHGAQSAAAAQTGSVGVAPTPAHAQKYATATDPVSYPPGPTVWPTGVEARAQSQIVRPIVAAVVQPRNDAWDLVEPPTELTMFQRGVQVQGAHRLDAQADTAAPHRGSSVWSSGEPFFTPSAFPPGAHMHGVRAPAAVGFAQQAAAVPPAGSASAAHSWPIGHAQQPPNAVHPGAGQPNDFAQLPLTTLRPTRQEPDAFLATDEVLDNTSCHRGQASESRGLGFSTINAGFMQGSRHVLPSPAASSSMVPTAQGAMNGEVPSTKGWTGVTKKLDKDEWIGRIILDRASTSLIVINSHFESEDEAARSIAAASHVMFVDKPTRGDLIPLTAADKEKLRGCTPHQCEVMVRMKFWHMWEEWRNYWPAAKAKWDAKMRKIQEKQAAITASLGDDDGRANKRARGEAEGIAGGETASRRVGSGTQDP
ncbi:unnamed protein product [Closterium sp. Yama58-4]|nr:unnamed protein product [Closterium sp. Yama58-4]